MVGLSEYSYKPLPDLGSDRYFPEHGSIRLCKKALLVVPGETLRETICAAFAVVLMKHLETDDFLFAQAPHSFSVDPESAQLRSFRVNYRKLVGRSDQSVSWRELASSIQTQLSTQDSSTTLEETRKQLQINDHSTPAFPAMFVWDHSSLSKKWYLKDGIVVGAYQAMYDLNVVIEFIADSSIISPSSLKLLAKQFELCVQQVINSPHMSPINDLFPPQLPSNYLSYSPSQHDVNSASLPVQWLLHQAETRPESIAYEMYDSIGQSSTTLTWKQINTYSNRLASYLIKNFSVKLESNIVLCSSRDSSFYVALASILKIGSCYVPIDPELSNELKESIAKHARPTLVLTDSTHYDLFEKSFRVVTLLDCMEIIKEEDSKIFSDKNVCQGNLDGIVYLNYSSDGSDARLMIHRGVYLAVENMNGQLKDITDAEKDSQLALSSFSNDLHLTEIIQSWALGIKLVSAPLDQLLPDLRKCIARLEITHITIDFDQAKEYLPSFNELSIKTATCRIDGWKEDDFTELLHKWSDESDKSNIRFITCYGRKETTMITISQQAKPQGRSENIGKIGPGSNAYVVDQSDLSIVPLGIKGELIIEGPSIAFGYKVSEAHKNSFLDTFSNNGWPAYRTGDLVRMKADYSIEILGKVRQNVNFVDLSATIHEIVRQRAGLFLDEGSILATHPSIKKEMIITFISLKRTSLKELSWQHVQIVSDSRHLDIVHYLRQSLAQSPTLERPGFIIPLNFIPRRGGQVDRAALSHFFTSANINYLVSLQGDA